MVQLESGSLPMTIESIGADGTVHCAWQTNGKIQRDKFAP
ncbi:MAG: hypothetical protein ACWA6X_07485 [Bauldia sp.]